VAVNQITQHLSSIRFPPRCSILHVLWLKKRKRKRKRKEKKEGDLEEVGAGHTDLYVQFYKLPKAPRLSV